MKLEDYVKTSFFLNEGKILLESKGATLMSVVGASRGLQISLTSRDLTLVNNLFISTSHDKDGVLGIVALKIFTSNRSIYFYLMQVEIKNGQLVAKDTLGLYIPRQGFLSQMREGAIDVVINGKKERRDILEVQHKGKIFRNVPLPGGYYVEDPDLLCSFLLGEVDYLAVLKAAREVKAEENNLSLLEKLRRELEQANRVAKFHSDIARTHLGKREDAESKIGAARACLENAGFGSRKQAIEKALRHLL